MARPATDHLAPDPPETVEALEQRVRRLEDAVAALQALTAQVDAATRLLEGK